MNIKTLRYKKREIFNIFICPRRTSNLSSLSSLFGKASTPGQSQTRRGRGFILLLPHAAVLPESDAASDVIKPASSFVIQNRQTSCSMWCPMYGARYLNVTCGLFSGAALALW